MKKLRRTLAAIGVASIVGLAPTVSHAGGGVGGGGSGSLVVAIDHPTPHGHNYGYLDYFSRNVTVHQGQVVTWQMANFTEPHTVTILPGNIPFGPQSEGLFNKLFPGANGGPDADDPGSRNIALLVNQYVQHNCGNSVYAPATGACSYNGKSVVNSGFLISGAQGARPQFAVRIDAAPGVYHYFCLIHGPAMSGTITVVPGSSAADTQASINQRAVAQAAAATNNTIAYESHLKAPSKKVNGHTQWTVFSGGQYGRVAIDEFIPQHLNIKHGDTVNWTPGFHTVTFPTSTPGFGFNLNCEVGAKDRPAFPPASWSTCNDLELETNQLTFPSGNSGKAYKGGYYNSGILVFPKPRPWSASFPSGGTYLYRCVLHPGMVASIASS